MTLREIVNYYLSEDIIRYKFPFSDSDIAMSESALEDISKSIMPMCFWRNKKMIETAFFVTNNVIKPFITPEIKFNDKKVSFVINEDIIKNFFNLESVDLYFLKKYILLRTSAHHFDLSKGLNFRFSSDRNKYSDAKYRKFLVYVNFYSPIHYTSLVRNVINKYITTDEFISNYRDKLNQLTKTNLPSTLSFKFNPANTPNSRTIVRGTFQSNPYNRRSYNNLNEIVEETLYFNLPPESIAQACKYVYDKTISEPENINLSNDSFSDTSFLKFNPYRRPAKSIKERDIAQTLKGFMYKFKVDNGVITGLVNPKIYGIKI